MMFTCTVLAEAALDSTAMNSATFASTTLGIEGITNVSPIRSLRNQCCVTFETRLPFALAVVLSFGILSLCVVASMLIAA